jgi:hypothetical protein
MNVDRRWWIAFACVAVVIAIALSQSVFRGSSEECGPVRDLLEYNHEQAALIASKADDRSAPSVPSVAEDAAYQQWADGLAQRAQEVNSPELTVHTVQVADLAAQFVAKLPRLRAETQARAPGASAPPVAYEMAALSDRLSGELAQLSNACPG